MHGSILADVRSHTHTYTLSLTTLQNKSFYLPINKKKNYKKSERRFKHLDMLFEGKIYQMKSFNFSSCFLCFLQVL